MPYLIDGHNLIGHMRDIRLNDPEDEARLIQMLSSFLNRVQKSGIVYFDQRAPGVQGKHRRGRLQVEFIAAPYTADHAIQNKLRQLKGEAHNYTIISSDHEVIQTAKERGAQVIESHKFIQQFLEFPSVRDKNEKPERILTSEEIRYWQKQFENPSKKD